MVISFNVVVPEYMKLKMKVEVFLRLFRVSLSPTSMWLLVRVAVCGLSIRRISVSEIFS